MLGGGEIFDVENVGRGVAVRSSTSTVHFIEFIIKEQVGVILWINEPALMGVAGADIGRLRDLDRVRFIGHINDGQCIFVVVEANFLADVLLIRALIDDALS